MFDRFFLKLKVNGLRNPGIYGNLLFYDLYTHHHPSDDVKLIQGYLQVGKEVCWHVWVEKGDDIFDIIRKSVEGDADFTYIKDTTPENFESDEEITKQYELYKEDKKEFWKKVPVKIKNFRAKMFQKDFL